MSSRELAVELVNRYNLRTRPDRSNQAWRCDRIEDPDFFVIEATWEDAVISYVGQAVNRAAGAE